MTRSIAVAVAPSPSVHRVTFTDGLSLEWGGYISPVTVAYETYGTLNNEGTNAILVCHALTANAHAGGDDGWWNGLIGPGKPFDTDRYYVVCPNILGSCYGTTGPISIDPRTGASYGISFPRITVRDIVSLQRKLLDALGVRRLVTVTGSSLGGMQVLEWGLLYPDFVESLIPVSVSARQSAWCLGLNAIARNAITGDPQWHGGAYTVQPSAGLALARMVGMMSYRSPQEFEIRFGRNRHPSGSNGSSGAEVFEVESYLLHQGQKLVQRFDANTYLTLSYATDSHDVTRNRGSLDAVLGSMRARTICIGVSTDVRYPPAEQWELVRLIPGARYAEVESVHGHDAFLIEFDKLCGLIEPFLTQADKRR